MKVGTSIATTHSLILDEAEVFDVKTVDDITVRVARVVAYNDGNGWHVQGHGKRVLKSGSLGKGMRLDTWQHSRRFTDQAQKDLFATLSQEVQDTLHELGVTV
jgi:hypothetical protein